MNFLYGDNTKALEAIKKDNPGMSDEQLAFSVEKLKEYGIVDSGDSLTLGIGACAGGGLPTPPPPVPESCPAGEHLVCTGKTATKLRRPQDMICRCDPLPPGR